VETRNRQRVDVHYIAEVGSFLLCKFSAGTGGSGTHGQAAGTQAAGTQAASTQAACTQAAGTQAAGTQRAAECALRLATADLYEAQAVDTPMGSIWRVASAAVPRHKGYGVDISSHILSKVAYMGLQGAAAYYMAYQFSSTLA
jgi:hypothetical protein